MKYDFDEIIERHNTNSLKWDYFDSKYPMWVADMDFNVLDDIKESIEKRSQHQIYAYSIVIDDLFNAYVNWWDRRHDIKLDKNNLLFSTGVMPSINSIIRCLSDENDKIVIQTPVYHVFFNVILDNNRKVVENELIYENNSYTIDFEKLESQLSLPDVKLMLLCNPHNPIGRIWTVDELERILKLCNKYDVILVSDEIHCDLVNPDLRYVPIFSLNGNLTENVIMCMSPTKTFNVAGLQSSAVYTDNIKLFELIQKQLRSDFYSMPNAFAVDATIAAFNKGDDWIDGLNEYLYNNKCIVYDFVDENNLDIDVISSEATYLLWVDCSRLSISANDFYELLKNSYGLYVSPGIQFGKNGSDFIRINIACTKKVLLESLSILKEAIFLINNQ